MCFPQALNIKQFHSCKSCTEEILYNLFDWGLFLDFEMFPNYPLLILKVLAEKSLVKKIVPEYTCWGKQYIFFLSCTYIFPIHPGKTVLIHALTRLYKTRCFATSSLTLRINCNKVLPIWQVLKESTFHSYFLLYWHFLTHQCVSTSYFLLVS